MLQYPKLEHVTLPSVESWGTNMNILRDPQKSITSRRVDKVGQNNTITELIDGSSDRICDSILVYARGVNPMSSVSYDNNSNNAGLARIAPGIGGVFDQTQNNGNLFNGRTQASLPYKAMNGEAFRPLIKSQRELMALSRLPRTWFGTTSQPGFVDYSKSKYCPSKFRVIRDLLSATDVETNKSLKVEEPIKENYKMDQSINGKHINFGADAGTRSMDISNFTRENIDLYKGVNDTIIEAWAETNKNIKGSQTLDGISINEKKYTHDFLNYSANTNNSVNHTQGLEDINMQTGKFIQDSLQYEQNAGYNPGYTIIGETAEPELERNFPVYEMRSSVSDPRVYKNVEHQNEIYMDRNIPLVSARTNITKIEDFNSMNLSSRIAKLPPTLKKDGFENKGTMPKFNGDVQLRSGISEKTRQREFVNEMQFGRNN